MRCIGGKPFTSKIQIFEDASPILIKGSELEILQFREIKFMIEDAAVGSYILSPISYSDNLDEYEAGQRFLKKLDNM